MSENTKCSKCGKEGMTKEMSNASFGCGPENYIPPTSLKPIYLCNECEEEYEKEYNDCFKTIG